MLIEKNKKNGGAHSRLGLKFHSEIEKIKDMRLRNGKSKERISTEKITNMIVRHKIWPQVFKDILSLEEEEIQKYGL